LVQGHDIVVIGGSAGSVEVLTRLVSQLPAGLPAALFVVVHVPPDSTSILPEILGRRGPLPAAHARHGEAIEPGRIYVAPPDRHLLLHEGHVHLARGPRENATRPAIDPLFRTAAQAYGPRVVAVVLSGTLDDGSVGLGVVKSRGGVALVQDPDEALFPGMPRSAMRAVDADGVLPVDALAARIAQLAHEPAREAPAPLDPTVQQEIDMAEMDPQAIMGYPAGGRPTDLTCPECRGPIVELGEAEGVHYRCRVGHAYSPETLYAQQASTVEAAIWSALQVLEERRSLAVRMSVRMEHRGHPRIAERYRVQAEEAGVHADVLRRVLLNGDGGGGAGDADGDEVPPGGDATPGDVR
jgi:two-component system chemotaxis response regulator CheB